MFVNLYINMIKITETIRLMMSMQVDQIKHNRITWNNNYLNPNSDEYLTMEDESVYAVSIQNFDEITILCIYLIRSKNLIKSIRFPILLYSNSVNFQNAIIEVCHPNVSKFWNFFGRFNPKKYNLLNEKFYQTTTFTKLISDAFCYGF